ncbi:hypothetical protein [Pseudomonas petrae]|uniref:hypothetical protein n=1 Tax=Pseudomonas petrae TaxID=2912190 RepID=UPI001F2AC999|nr:hypothetical protein [Pseudomonas petrae]MCF7555125.1 hypothetical protein [Pseudomonas petrae]
MMINQTCLDAGTGSRGLKKALVSSVAEMYRPPIAAKSANGFDGPTTCRRTTSAPISNAGVFFVPAFLLYGGCAWETERSAGVLYARSVNLRTAATLIRLTANRGSSSHTGATPMLTQDPSVLIGKANAHRAMAMAALRANSSLSVRAKRYSHHIEIARRLEAQAVTK